MKRPLFLPALALGCALVAANAVATPITLSLTGGSTSSGVKSYVTGGIDVTASGWADTGGTPIGWGYEWGDDLLRQGAVQTWTGSGIGVCNKDEQSKCPANQHAVDNQDDHDMILLTFSEAVVLDAFKLGWWSNDSDVTLLAFGGAGEYDLNGKQWSQLQDGGWLAVGDYFNNRTNTTSTGTEIASQYWLIGAYNGLFGAEDHGGKKDKNTDYLKLGSISFSLPELPPEEPPHEVPEPGSLALLAMGALGLAAARRRRRD